MNETLDQLLARRAKCITALNEVDELIAARKALTLVRCEDNIFGVGCGQACAVGELEYIQTQRWVPPRGCSEGAYWADSQSEWECPDCGHRNRVYDKPDIVALKHLFKSVREEQKRNDRQLK